MSRKFDEEVVVRIWRNLKTYGRIPTSHFGHAAVTARGPRTPGGMRYISFWPGNSAGKDLSAVRSQPGSASDGYALDKVGEMNRLTALRLEVGYCQKEGIKYPKKWDKALSEAQKTPIMSARDGQRRAVDVDGKVFRDDDGFPLWSQSPQAKVFLPGIGCKQRMWGLSTRRMGKWWDNFMATNPNYKALGHQNCAGVALEALKQGGAGAIVKSPSVTIYGEPVQVENYARELEIQLGRMDDWATHMLEEARAAILSGAFSKKSSQQLAPLHDGIWSLDDWKKQSALGTFQVRSMAIRKIDDAVARYHQADWKAKFVKRYTALADIFMGIGKHRQEKPESKRSEPLLRLGMQVIAILRNPGPIW